MNFRQEDLHESKIQLQNSEFEKRKIKKEFKSFKKEIKIEQEQEQEQKESIYLSFYI